MKNDIKYCSESDLIQQFHQGSEAVLKIIYDLHFSALWSFAKSIIKDGDAADDLVAGSIVKLWQKRNQMNSLKGILAYLYAIIRNDCLQYLRDQSRLSKLQNEFNYINQLQPDFELEEIRARLIQLILLEAGKMPNQMKIIFKLAYLDGHSTTQIAHELGLSEHTIHTQKKRALKRLRKEFSGNNFLEFCFIIIPIADLIIGFIRYSM